jgi:hypothetical protein
MPLHYHTEYQLGRWGGHVCRTHQGIQAVLAILVDVGISLVFSIASLVFAATWLVIVSAAKLTRFMARVLFELVLAVVRFLAEVVQAPVRALKWVTRRATDQAAAKPAFSAFREV